MHATDFRVFSYMFDRLCRITELVILFCEEKQERGFSVKIQRAWRVEPARPQLKSIVCDNSAQTV